MLEELTSWKLTNLKTKSIQTRSKSSIRLNGKKWQNTFFDFNQRKIKQRFKSTFSFESYMQLSLISAEYKEKRKNKVDLKLHLFKVPKHSYDPKKASFKIPITERNGKNQKT